MKRTIIALCILTATATFAGTYGTWEGQRGWVQRKGLTTSEARRMGAYPWHAVEACGENRTVGGAGEPVPMGTSEIAARDGAPYRVWEADHWRAMTAQEREDYDAEQAAAVAAQYPEPTVVLAELDAETGEPTGRTFREYVIDGAKVLVLNSASPPRPWADQKADFRARGQKKKAAKAELSKPGNSDRKKVELILQYLGIGEEDRN